MINKEPGAVSTKSREQNVINVLSRYTTAKVVSRASREAPAVALIALTGSYELAIHAWGIAVTTRNGPTLPTPLVEALLIYAPVVLADVERAGLFAAQRDPAGRRSDNDRLLAMFGRASDWRSS
jgi:hypothetical protein